MFANDFIQADKAFCNFVKTHGVNAAFAKFAHNHAILLKNNFYTIVGMEKVKQYLSKRNDADIRLGWEPEFADIAQSGELGYTYGTYDLYGAETDSLIEQGSYVTIWKKRQTAIGNMF